MVSKTAKYTEHYDGPDPILSISRVLVDLITATIHEADIMITPASQWENGRHTKK